MLRTDKNDGIVVSTPHARTNFGELLRRVEDERRSFEHSRPCDARRPGTRCSEINRG
jgi:hypothetical protein